MNSSTAVISFNHSNHDAGLKAMQQTTADLIFILNVFDCITRVISFLVFLLYFFLFFISKEMRRTGLLYMHHANLASLFYLLMWLIYLFDLPSQLDLVYCLACEFVWSLLKYLRPYSVALMGAYRLTAVFSNRLFKRINASRTLLLAPIAFVWLVCISLALLAKHAFSTTHSIMCFDGYSSNRMSTVNYLIFTSVLALILPFCLILLIYMLIHYKLKRSMRKLNGFNKRITHGDKQNNNKLMAMRKNDKINSQLGWMLFFYTISFATSMALNGRHVWPSLFDSIQQQDATTSSLYSMIGGQLIRMLNLLIDTLFPILSIFCHSDIRVKKIIINNSLRILNLNKNNRVASLVGNK